MPSFFTALCSPFQGWRDEKHKKHHRDKSHWHVVFNESIFIVEDGLNFSSSLILKYNLLDLYCYYWTLLDSYASKRTPYFFAYNSYYLVLLLLLLLILCTILTPNILKLIFTSSMRKLLIMISLFSFLVLMIKLLIYYKFYN